jgi:hypothetical protein
MFEGDAEAREHFGFELEEIMDILRIESSDGLLSYSLSWSAGCRSGLLRLLRYPPDSRQNHASVDVI